MGRTVAKNPPQIAIVTIGSRVREELEGRLRRCPVNPLAKDFCEKAGVTLLIGHLATTQTSSSHTRICRGISLGALFRDEMAAPPSGDSASVSQ